MRSREDVYPEIIKELYMWLFKKNIGAVGYIKHLKHITKTFPLVSPSKVFADSVKVSDEL